MMVFIFHLLYILARISKHHSKVKVSILFCVYWMHFGVLLLTIAIETDAKIWQIYIAWRNYFLHAHPVRSLKWGIWGLQRVLGTLQPHGLTEELAVTILHASSGLCGTTCSSQDSKAKGKDRGWKRDNSISYVKQNQQCFFSH